VVRNLFHLKRKAPQTTAKRRAAYHNVDRILLIGLTVLGILTLIYAWQNAHLDLFPTFICAAALLGWGVISVFIYRKH